MSYNNYILAKKLIEKNKPLIGKTFPQSQKAIRKAQEILGVSFPKSYTQFLEDYGMLDIGFNDVLGLDYNYDYKCYNYFNIVCNVLEERKNVNGIALPNTFITIYDLGDGEKFCLDTARMNDEGECPIVGWYFGKVSSLQNDVGEDFGDFLLNFVIVPSLENAEKENQNVRW